MQSSHLDETPGETPLPPLAHMSSTHDKEKDKLRIRIEVASGVSALISALVSERSLGRNYDLSLLGGSLKSDPLTRIEVMPLVDSIGLGRNSARSAIAALVQLVHCGALSNKELLGALKNGNTRDVVDLLVPPGKLFTKPQKNEYGALIAADDKATPGTRKTQKSDSGPLHDDAMQALDEQLAQSSAALCIAVSSAKGTKLDDIPPWLRTGKSAVLEAQSGRELLQSHGAVRHLVTQFGSERALQGTSAALTLMTAFRCLVSGCKAAQNDARKAGFRVELDRVLRRGCEAAQLCALGAVAAYCSRNTANREEIRMAGLIQLIVKYISPTVYNGRLASSAAVAIMHLCANDVESQAAVIDEGGVEALAALWAYHHVPEGGDYITYEDDPDPESEDPAFAGRMGLSFAAERALYEIARGETAVRGHTGRQTEKAPLLVDLVTADEEAAPMPRSCSRYDSDELGDHRKHNYVVSRAKWWAWAGELRWALSKEENEEKTVFENELRSVKGERDALQRQLAERIEKGQHDANATKALSQKLEAREAEVNRLEGEIANLDATYGPTQWERTRKG